MREGDELSKVDTEFDTCDVTRRAGVRPAPALLTCPDFATVFAQRHSTAPPATGFRGAGPGKCSRPVPRRV
jgi:hypothetical protein